MRIAVLGGAGLTGRAAVRNLVENRDVSEVLVGDLNEKALRKLSNKVASSKLVTMQLDVRDVERVATFIRGCDAVINAVQYYHNIDVMYAALKVGVHYVDHGGLYRVTLKQLEMDHLFKSARQTALVGMGAQPGLTNIVARDAYEILDEVNAVYIKDGSRDLTEPSPLKITWSLQTLLDEVVDAVIFHDGEYRSVPPLSMSEVVDFPQPIGRMETFVIIHSEVATLPRSFRDKELRACDWMEGSPDLPMIKRLADMGLASTEMLDVDGCRVSPRRFLIRLLDIGGAIGIQEEKTPNDWEITRVIVQGKKGGKPAKRVYDIVFPPKPEWRMSCVQFGVGVLSSIAAMMLARGEIINRGVVPPGRCVEPELFISEIPKHGIRITITQTEDFS